MFQWQLGSALNLKFPHKFEYKSVSCGIAGRSQNFFTVSRAITCDSQKAFLCHLREKKRARPDRDASDIFQYRRKKRY